ncbi:ATP-dependent Clp protease ATP-binding subunit ClpX [bacterium AH-315-F18]|nr:ATP-dependent Clp protease ATP-binding subunit ClpX [bacterium AH-315-F18]
MSRGRRSDREVERCVFCGKGSHMVERLIAGPPGIYICSECVTLCHSIIQEEHRKSVSTGMSLSDVPTPVEIKDQLDRYVIGQEHAKKVLSVAVNIHYKRILSHQDHDFEMDVELDKSNVLLIGPTGCGKTLMAKTLARILDVPFAIGDATTLTEAGYVGEDVENVLLRLLQAADYDLQRAERGIIFLDEIDKIGKTSQNVSITRDVSGEGVQQALLKMLEGTVSNIPPQGGRKHPEQQYIQLDTTNILFICGGTFVGLDEIIGQRLGKRYIGFDQDGMGDDRSLRELLPHTETDDIIKYGMIPELVGRLPVITTLTPLDEEDLVRVMLEPRNAIVRQYQALFKMEGHELSFTENALKVVAEKALIHDTGARGLRSIFESVMLDVLYDLPQCKQPTTCKIDVPQINGEAKVKLVPSKKAKAKSKPKAKAKKSVVPAQDDPEKRESA